MKQPDLLSYLVAGHVLMATPGVQLAESLEGSRVATLLASVARRVRRLRGAL